MQPKIKKHLANYQRTTYTKCNTLQLEENKRYLDCALGNNPYGCSPMLLEHSPAWDINTLADYPQTSKYFIREIIRYWEKIIRLQEVNIHLEAGAFGVIERLNKLFVDEKSVTLGYCPQFSDYMQDVLACGGTFQYISLQAEHNYKFNAQDLISALTPACNLVYLDNPNNPTGQTIPLPEIEMVVQEAQKLDIAVLIDEAYGDFIPQENSAVALVKKYGNLFVARSFTKGFGLAGLRVGYVVMPEPLAELFAKVAHPFPVNALGQLYAESALQDSSFLTACQEKIRSSKSNIISACSKLGVLETHPTTPIMTLVHPNPAINLFEEFLKRRVLVTSGEHFVGLGKNSVRLRIPNEQDQLIIKTIQDIEETVISR